MEISIREWREEDADALAKALDCREILDNLRDGLPFPYTKKDAEEYIRAMLASDKNEVFARAICADGCVIGSIGVFRQTNIHCRCAEIGYYIAKEFWGRGIAVRAVKLLCAYLFKNTDLLRIYAEPFADNVRSCRVLEKAGFTLEGVLRSNAVKCGKVKDMKMYSLIKDELALSSI